MLLGLTLAVLNQLTPFYDGSGIMVFNSCDLMDKREMLPVKDNSGLG